MRSSTVWREKRTSGLEDVLINGRCVTDTGRVLGGSVVGMGTQSQGMCESDPGHVCVTSQDLVQLEAERDMALQKCISLAGRGLEQRAEQAIFVSVGLSGI